MKHSRLFLGLALAGAFVLVTLTGCSKPQPPVGRWEGGYQFAGTLVAARVEVMPDGQVRVSAPDITNLDLAKPDRLVALRQELAADLATGWDGIAPRPFDFDGKTFRKPGQIAPQMVWDKKTNQMELKLYIGANPAMPVPLRPVPGFHDNPWAMG